MKVSVVIPVGPSEANKRWLFEAVHSVEAQTHDDLYMQFVEDMSDLAHSSLMDFLPNSRIPWSVYKMPWYSGVAHSFNAGVMQSPTNLNFMLGSDDWLEPTCIEECLKEYELRNGDPFGYFYTGVRYSDTGETQDVACHAAMVSKSLWRKNGGLPIQAASGASDAALLSVMLGNSTRAGRIWKVGDGKPLYNYRRHSETDTASKGAWQGVILETRHLVTLEWKARDV